MNFGTDAFKIIKFFVINGVFDKPARAEILNMKNSTGYYGCLKCKQIGLNMPTKKSIY